jgi:hypothetical protein
MTKAYEFTKEEEDRIYELHKEGVSVKNIGIRFNVSSKPIQRILTKKYDVVFQDYAKVGDIVNGWQIMNIYLVNTGGQQVRMAKIKSVVPGCEKEDERKLMFLTNQQIGWPDRRRPDNTERNTTHGESKSRIYRLWASMVDRCRNKERFKLSNYYKYNINCCDEWQKYENFKEWSMSNGYDESLSLDRIDPKGDYSPENCRWTTKEVQAYNKILAVNVELTAFGETKNLSQWVSDERCVVNRNTLKSRIGAGWDHETALTQESERKCKVSINLWLKETYPDIYDQYINDYHIVNGKYEISR